MGKKEYYENLRNRRGRWVTHREERRMEQVWDGERGHVGQGPGVGVPAWKGTGDLESIHRGDQAKTGGCPCELNGSPKVGHRSGTGRGGASRKPFHLLPVPGLPATLGCPDYTHWEQCLAAGKGCCDWCPFSYALLKRGAGSIHEVENNICLRRGNCLFLETSRHSLRHVLMGALF